MPISFHGCDTEWNPTNVGGSQAEEPAWVGYDLGRGGAAAVTRFVLRLVPAAGRAESTATGPRSFSLQGRNRPDTEEDTEDGDGWRTLYKVPLWNHGWRDRRPWGTLDVFAAVPLESLLLCTPYEVEGQMAPRTIYDAGQ